MTEITSNQNPKLKHLKKLKSKKYRDRFGQYLLEGVKSIELALKEKSVVEGIYIERSQIETNIESFLKRIGYQEKLVYVVEDELLKTIYETGTPQGVLAIVKKQSNLFEDLWSDGMRKIVFLDRVQDPGNLGTIIRTAEGAGYDLVVCNVGCADLYSPKTLRSTMGSVVTMKIACDVDDKKVLEFFKTKNFRIVCSTLRNSVDYKKAMIKDSHVIVLGNEGAGIQEDILSQSDCNVTIPMHGKVESLNVSVAAGILFYHFGDTP